MKKFLTLGELITLIQPSMGAFEVALMVERSNGDVYASDCPVGYYEVEKDYFLGTYRYSHTGDKKLVDESTFSELHVLGITPSSNIDVEYPFTVCVRIKPEQARWAD